MDETGLMYYDARYYDPELKRFTSVDPVAVEDVMRAVNTGPQTLNPYSYVSNNPLKYNDPTGEWYKEFFIDNINPFTVGQSWSSFNAELGQATQQMTSNSHAWDLAVSNPKTTGAAIGVGSAAIVAPGTASVAAISTIKSGVGANFVAGRVTSSVLYGYLTKGAADNVPGLIDTYNDINASDSATIFGAIKDTMLIHVPGQLPEKISEVAEVFELGNEIRKDLTKDDDE